MTEELPAKFPGSHMGAFRRRSIMLSLCLTLFLSAIDVTIVATALPTIASSLNANASEYAWVGSAYTLASTSSSPIWAKISDIFGRKPTLMTANGVFMAGSVVAALANSAAMLVGGRVLQGLGGGGLLVLVTIIIGDLFELRDRAKYYGLTGLVWAVAGATGPVLGGVFTETIGWRWCFWINLPFEALSLVMLFFVLDIETTPISVVEGMKSLDWIGSAIIVGGTICFLYGLESGASGLQGWNSAMVICLLVFGGVLLVAFFVYEAKVAAIPIIPMSIFSSVSNIAAFVMTCIHSFVFIAYDYFLPLYFQVVLGFTPIISGVALFALVVPLSLATAGTGIFVGRTGNFWIPICFGAVFMTLGTGLLIDLGNSSGWAQIICFEIITGLGAGPLFQAPMIALQNQLQPAHTAPAMSAFSFMRSLFSSCSIVVGSVFLQSGLGGNSLTEMSTSHNSDETLQGLTLATKEQYVTALRSMWIFYTAVSSILLVCAACLNRENVKKDTPTESPTESEESEPEKAGV